jgi:putative transposase
VKAGSSGAIIGQIKSVCTKRIWAAGHTEFRWQSRFYDHIIRDEGALRRIREYIVNNPVNWAEDRINPANPSDAVVTRGEDKAASLLS